MSAWQPIESAPRDGTYVLAIVGGASERWEHLNGRAFVIRHEGQTRSDFDLGWSVYPGLGGAGDQWFTYWTPLPAAPSSEEQRCIPSEASSSCQTRDDLLTPPTPSACSELVEKIINRLNPFNGAVYVSVPAVRERDREERAHAVTSIGVFEIEYKRQIAEARAEAAQQTITQLTRERDEAVHDANRAEALLGEAVKVLEKITTLGTIGVAWADEPSFVARSFLSDLSPQGKTEG